ncbi:hypothetical protein [Candidatus Thiosymbion oneisti]|uniref:hypothetical protein n=1 Tax=Candidatus Thiosymbion oneisti TaxID=589554 RepID=UPI00105E76C5|nr:hypothetical protein [Candidatus Thiosymbion oneisti]
MSNRDDIKDERLIYTCNCGWIDLDHMEDSAKYEFVGAKNLWKQIRGGDLPPGVDPRRLYDRPGPGCFPYVDPRERCARFHDGDPGYKVTYRQGMSHKRIKPVRAGIERSYLVRYGLTPQEKRVVALAIFMEVSVMFEGFQGSFPWRVATNSGFSQEDLVSNLLSFYIAVDGYDLDQVETICKKVSTEVALAIWDREGSVEENKNPTFEPAFAKEPGAECTDSEQIFPKAFTKIRPAIKGGNFIDFPSLLSVPGSWSIWRD